MKLAFSNFQSEYIAVIKLDTINIWNCKQIDQLTFTKKKTYKGNAGMIKILLSHFIIKWWKKKYNLYFYFHHFWGFTPFFLPWQVSSSVLFYFKVSMTWLAFHGKQVAIINTARHPAKPHTCSMWVIDQNISCKELSTVLPNLGSFVQSILIQYNW